MAGSIRDKILGFINSTKDAPVTGGIAIGVYMIMYYYSKNMDLAASLIQLLFFTAYYLVLPVIILWLGYKVFSVNRLLRYRNNFLFVAIPLLVCFFLLQLSLIGPLKRVYFIVALLLLTAASFKFAKYYKLFIVLLSVMALTCLPVLLTDIYTYAFASEKWKQLPDDILQAKFTKKPNVYYIQPDGYTSPENLKNGLYNFDNLDFEGFLSNNGFVVYPDARSNYYSTLLSNSSIFSMQHHYIQQDIERFTARGIIVGDNPVLKIFKNNGYQTHFITEKPYLLINRPALAYDTANFGYDELPFLKDAWNLEADVATDFKKQFSEEGSHFYFIEKMTPSHVAVFNSAGVEEERQLYINRLKETNKWLKSMVSFISEKDPEGLIIIAADHGGYAGFKDTQQSLVKTDNPLMVKSIYGSLMAIKWGKGNPQVFDKNLKTTVNLFRVVFAYLADNNSYLKHLQDDASYIRTERPAGLYEYIDTNGKVVFNKK